MAKAKNPITFSNHYGISNQRLDVLGIFDPTISIDTKLFIDPLLLAFSSHTEINTLAVQVYRERFEHVIKFLSLSNKREDIGWRTAKRLLEFHEIKGTCLGYGAGSISGSGFGPKLTNHILSVAKEIVDLGVRDPDLFPLMAIFESDIGPDRISDMVTNVISPALISFNKRILSELNLKSEKYTVNGQVGLFIPNPYEDETPIILLPNDILRKLPVAKDWDQVADVAAKNQELRNKVNAYIGHIWAKKTKREKAKLKKQAMSSKAAFDTLLEVFHSVPPIPYDISNDPDGLISWARLSQNLALKYPLKINGVKTVLNLESANEIVKIIISQFKPVVSG